MARLLLTNHTKDPGAADGGIYLLDTSGGKVRRIFSEPMRGVTQGPGGYYFVTTDGEIFFMASGGEEVVHRASVGYGACHDLRWNGSAFELVASRGNWVVRLDEELREQERIRIVEDDEDVCHANCVAHKDGATFLSIFTLTPGPQRVKRLTNRWRKDGKILRLDWSSKSWEVVHEPLAQPHSLVFHDGRLHICESFASTVTVLSPDMRQATTACRLTNFVRGLVFDGDRVFVGVSHRRRPHPHLMTRLSERLRRWCGVVELDAATWKPIRRHAIPGRQVYEMLLLEE